MKLASLYTVWNALELLEGSIDQIYNDTDLIVIGWQKKSHYGVFSTEVEAFCIQLKKKYKKVKLVEFIPQRGNAKQQERSKINQMIKFAQRESCTHFFLSATDHYYVPSQFVIAKEKAKQYDVTASKMYTYFKDPSWRLQPIETYYMPFICKLRVNQTHSANTRGKWNVYVDPALCILPNDSFYEFKEEELMMHHYSFIRKDIEGKLRIAAAKGIFAKKIDSIIEDYKAFNGTGKIPYYSDHTIKVVKNYFNIVVH